MKSKSLHVSWPDTAEKNCYSCRSACSCQAAITCENAQYRLCQHSQPCQCYKHKQHRVSDSKRVVSHTATWIVSCRKLRTYNLNRLWLYLCILICLSSSSSFVSGKSVGGGSIPSVDKPVDPTSVFPVDNSEDVETGTPIYMELAGSPFSSEDNTALWR